MKKIEIHNFGPIKDAIIDIKPMLVLIGPQASGKSTIAKLIYFFETLPDDFYLKYYQSPNLKFDITSDLIIPIRSKFYDLFGSTRHLPSDFTIICYYGEAKTLTLSIDEGKKLFLVFSDDFFTNKKSLSKNKRELLQLKNELNSIDIQINVARRVELQEQQLNKLHSFNDFINSIFCNAHNDELYIIAGRNATVGYSEVFADLFRQSLEKKLADQGKRIYSSKEQTIDETLMMSFMQKVIRMKQTFVNYGNIEGMISSASDYAHKNKLSLAHGLISKVLRGQYSPDKTGYGERIVHGKRYVYLRDASSGQQESIRILQDAFLGIFQGNKLFRIVEEPEAHLFPEAQKATIELLTLTLNNKDENNLIITTHSPYTLTVINNLIFAAKEGEVYPEKVEKIIPKDFWLPTKRVAAYYLNDGTAESIIDDELGEIKAERIDEISHIINQEYDNIYNIQYESETDATSEE